MDELIAKMWGNFKPPKCKECGGHNVIIEDTMGFSEMSGSWGNIKIKCVACEQSDDRDNNEHIIADT